MSRMPTLISATALASAFFATHTYAQTANYGAAPPADLHPPINLDADTLRAQLTPSQLGLKRQSGASASGIGLPFGMSYNRDAKGLIVPLDEKSEWGVGIGLNVNSTTPIEAGSANSLGLQPKRTPGFMLHKKF